MIFFFLTNKKETEFSRYKKKTIKSKISPEYRSLRSLKQTLFYSDIVDFGHNNE